MTSSVLTSTLPAFVVIKSDNYTNGGHLYYKDGSVVLGEPSVFSALVKIEAERATSNDRYVNLRFCSSNKYWQKNESDDLVVARSNKPEEDTSKLSCTLFEAIKVDGTELFYLEHVPTGGRLLFREPSMSLYVEPNPGEGRGYLNYVNWDTLIKLPEHVAFKGDNGQFLRAYWDDHFYLRFNSSDPTEDHSGNRVSLMPNGYIRIKNDHSNEFWRRSPDWIWTDTTDTTADNEDTLFWPVKIDNKTIALRNGGNNMGSVASWSYQLSCNRFCKRLTEDGMHDCLNASASTMTNETRLEVQELVNERKIYNVRYRMEDARVYGETPYVAGSTIATNYGDQEGSIAIEIMYQNESSYSFSNSLSISLGVTNTIKAGVPEIAEEEIAISFEINTTMEWGTTTTKTTSVTATGGVAVPAKSKAVIRYVGTKGTCDVPFTYTQQDRSATDGSVTETEMSDGVYTGVNCYNFDFVIEKAEPI